MGALETKTLCSDVSPVAAPLATSSDVEDLRRSLANTEKDMAKLARSFAGIVEDPVKSAGSSEVTTQGSKDPLDIQRQLQRMSTDLSARVMTTETNFTNDLKHVREMLTACLALLRAMQEDVQDLRPRVGSLEVQIVGFQLRTSSQVQNHMAGVPLKQQQQQQQQQQQVTKVPPRVATEQPDASNDPVSILANLQRLLLGRAPDSGAGDAANTSQPAVSPVTIVNEAKSLSAPVPATVAEPALQ